MSASIATARRAISSAEVAGPAVFQVMTRMAVSVFAGRLSVPIPRPRTIAPFARTPTTATITTVTAERDDLGDRCQAFHPEEVGSGEHRDHGDPDHRNEDPQSSTHVREPMTAF